MRPRIAFACCIAAWIAAAPSLARAADHGDGPQALADPSADITDLFAWMSNDGSKVYLVLDVTKGATVGSKFSTAIRYTFHVASRVHVGDADGPHPVDVICTFDVAQRISCWVGNADYVSGDASNVAGVTSASGKVKVFAGLRDDPFFFNSGGFNAFAGVVAQNKGGFMRDAAGCPMIDNAASQAFLNLLKGSGLMGGQPIDNFAKLNVLSIVLSIDKTLLARDGNLIAVWAATHKP
jgi:hypothetical protein